MNRTITAKQFTEKMNKGVPVVAMDSADVENYKDLSQIGISFTDDYLRKAVVAMDDAQGLTTAPNGGTPVQFLQNWLPGFVGVATAPRKIDEIIGVTTAGNWYDDEVVVSQLETLGDAQPYSDLQNVPLTGYNVNFEKCGVVRFEKGFMVTKLESERAAAMNLDVAATKRTATLNALAIQRNNIGFYGYNDGMARTYGLLNDPNLIAYKTVATGSAKGTKWSTKTYLEIIADLRTAFTELEVQSNGIIDPVNTATTLVLPTGATNYLAVVSDFGVSVKEWLNQTYPQCRIVTAPQLIKANGDADVFYLFADRVLDDVSTDGGEVFKQIVPATYVGLGIEQKAKGWLEDSAMATAGVTCLRPYAVTRWTGI